MIARFLARLFPPRDTAFQAPAQPDAPWQSDEHMNPLPRTAVIVRTRQPFVNWVRGLGPEWANYSLKESRREDSIAYLLPSHELEIEEAQNFIRQHWRHFFAQALTLWNTDPANWPQNRTLAQFEQWFELEHSNMVLDLGGYGGDEAE